MRAQRCDEGADDRGDERCHDGDARALRRQCHRRIARAGEVRPPVAERIRELRRFTAYEFLATTADRPSRGLQGADGARYDITTDNPGTVAAHEARTGDNKIDVVLTYPALTQAQVDALPFP